MDSRQDLAAALERARAQTEAILATVPDAVLESDVSPFAWPLVWEYVEIGRFEELWLLRNLAGERPLEKEHAEVYEAFRRGRDPAGTLPPLRARAARAYAAEVRGRALAHLEDADLDAPDALLRNGYVFGLVVQHELRRQEALLQTLQLRTDAEYPVPPVDAPDRAPAGPDEIEVPGGAFLLGAVDEPWAYDNELVAHEVELQPYRIDRAPVTNRAFAEFVADRGYRTRRHWSAQGWQWRTRTDVHHPLYWVEGPDGWERIRFGRREPVPPDEPVQHVSYHEAEAFARWAGKRLPTEAEWERAAGWDERRGKTRYPWGQESMGYEANLGRRRFSPAPAGSYGGGVSPVGCVQMAGDVWEWTTSFFQPYPGFLAFPYPEYSEVFFGEEYRVLRGGSWATDPLLARVSFRSWDEPGRRHVFAGFRCARDA
jgi:iron(II)-dependent oxidoreductase